MDKTTEKMRKSLICPFEAPSSPLIWIMLSGMLSKAISMALVREYITEGEAIKSVPSAPVHELKPSSKGEKPTSARSVRTPHSRFGFDCKVRAALDWRREFLNTTHYNLPNYSPLPLY